MNLRITFALALLLYFSTSSALKLHSYVNEKGETVFTNLPADCVKDAKLTCLQYHPLISEKKPNSKIQSNPVDHPPSRSAASRSGGVTSNNSSGHQGFEVLERMVEMNRIVNKYYPGKADALQTDNVRQSQESILKVLRGIRNIAGDDEKPSIDRAIDVLRSNLVE